MPESPLPTLPTLLSQVLVAFTIEVDNEFERQMPHRTATAAPRGSRGQGPWLVSLVMFSNLLRFVGDDDVRVSELQGSGGNLAGMERWRYVTVKPDPGDDRAKPPRRDWLVQATSDGRRARVVWPAVLEAVERRWQERFGEADMAELRARLQALDGRLDRDLPAYLPVVGYGLWAKAPAYLGGAASPNDLSALLSRALLTFTLDFEAESPVSLAVAANVLRLVGGSGARLRDLPRHAGVSREAVDMAVGWLHRRGYATVAPDTSSGRGKRVDPTGRGRAAHAAYRARLDSVQRCWVTRFGADELDGLRTLLERLAGDGTAEGSPLFAGLVPHDDGWRAKARRPGTLPHHPMVLHRGGFPDGS